MWSFALSIDPMGEFYMLPGDILFLLGPQMSVLDSVWWA